MLKTNRIYIFFIVIGGLLFFSCKKEPQTEPPTEDLSVSMLQKVNQLRNTGCMCGSTFMPPVTQLQWNKQLELAAQTHAMDMYSKNYFDHISPTGTIPIQRAEVAGYTGTYVTENIGKNYTSVDAVMNAWQNSESHCKAMMDSMHTVMGAAVLHKYWVQEFGKE
jgi:uncharacterized protein YkwD